MHPRQRLGVALCRGSGMDDSMKRMQSSCTTQRPSQVIGPLSNLDRKATAHLEMKQIILTIRADSEHAGVSTTKKPEQTDNSLPQSFQAGICTLSHKLFLLRLCRAHETGRPISANCMRASTGAHAHVTADSLRVPRLRFFRLWRYMLYLLPHRAKVPSWPEPTERRCAAGSRDVTANT